MASRAEFTCPQGHVYYLRSRSGRNGVCEHDGESLRRRDDDTPDIVRRRLTVYREQTAPLEDFYAQQRLLLRIDGSQPPDDGFDAVRVALAQPLDATSPPAPDRKNANVDAAPAGARRPLLSCGLRRTGLTFALRSVLATLATHGHVRDPTLGPRAGARDRGRVPPGLLGEAP